MSKKRSKYKNANKVIETLQKDHTDYFARALAVVGILISLGGFYLQWQEYKESRPNVRITRSREQVSYFYEGSTFSKEKNAYTAAIGIKLINDSTRPISIQDFYIREKDSNHYYAQSFSRDHTALPKGYLPIDANTRYDFHVDRNEILPSIVTLQPAEMKCGYVIFNYFKANPNNFRDDVYGTFPTDYATVVVDASTTTGMFTSTPLFIPLVNEG